MHQHGGTPEKDFERLGIIPRPVLDFSVNISPLGPPDEIRRIWPQLINEMEHYPQIDGCGVKQFYQKRFGLPPTTVLPGNGSVDLIYDIPKIFKLKRVLIPQPSFHDYTRACQTTGAKIITGLTNQLKECDAMFVGNPNNPTGQLIPADVLLALSAQFPEILFLIDEAFIQFIDQPEIFSLMRTEYLRKNIIIFHSLTKTYALPGLRIGACVSSQETIARIAANRAPWMVNRAAERVAETLAECGDYELRLQKLIRTERKRVFRTLENHPRFKPVPGSANFLLVQWIGSDYLDDLLARLLDQELYVRDCRNFPTLEKNWFRIAIRLPEENDRLLKVLSEC